MGELGTGLSEKRLEKTLTNSSTGHHRSMYSRNTRSDCVYDYGKWLLEPLLGYAKTSKSGCITHSTKELINLHPLDSPFKNRFNYLFYLFCSYVFKRFSSFSTNASVMHLFRYRLDDSNAQNVEQWSVSSGNFLFIRVVPLMVWR